LYIMTIIMATTIMNASRLITPAQHPTPDFCAAGILTAPK